MPLMNKRIVILLIALLTGGVAVFQAYRRPPADSSGGAGAPGPEQRAHPLIFVEKTHVPEHSAPAELAAPQDLLSRMAGQTLQQRLPSLFAGKTGSYTTRELMSGGATQEFTVSTGWITPLFDRRGRLPVLSMRVLKNPETGSYEIKGAGIALPGSGLEAGAESELTSEEYKAVIQWKKSF